MCLPQVIELYTIKGIFSVHKFYLNTLHREKETPPTERKRVFCWNKIDILSLVEVFFLRVYLSVSLVFFEVW